LDKIHIDLININDPSKGFTGFISAESRTKFAKNFAEKKPFTLTLLNGSKLFISKEMMELYTFSLLTSEISKQVVANYEAQSQGG